MHINHRAGVTPSLEQSDFTSIQQRIREYQQVKASSSKKEPSSVNQFQLLPFVGAGAEHQTKKAGINFAFADYLELIDWTGRCIRNDKKGFIASSQPKILQQLGITADAWLEHSEQFMERYANVSGKWSQMCAFKQRIGGQWCKGKSASHQLHPN
ncbi:hypothetical protein [Photobacterium phosphoreum]|uniref:hypothetical protein n=1 Tax=Photobacterium phosphoreum TaxID=659 RepID=UPI0006969386|nr:hypothetical protein [Photobacterium phosphoreum]PQJ85702.1 hypothetical protein BTO21_12675 [Photobacterium phosphoreum]PSV71508.1 hypothetical protein CTM77_07740 [Photobacterium phosphoreum]PSW40667.1 hypothetical protein CTM70_10505 [Photobacterium phosphoreum]